MPRRRRFPAFLTGLPRESEAERWAVDGDFDDEPGCLQDIINRIKRFGSIEIGEAGFGEASDYHPHHVSS